MVGCIKYVKEPDDSTDVERHRPVDYLYVQCALSINDTTGKNFFDKVYLSEQYTQGTYNLLKNKGLYSYSNYPGADNDPASILFSPAYVDKYTVVYNTSATLVFTTNELNKGDFFCATNDSHFDWFYVKQDKDLTIEFKYGDTREHYSPEKIIKAFNQMIANPRSERKYLLIP